VPDGPEDRYSPHHRRDFFRLGMARLLGPALDYVEKRLPVRELGGVLRPPGAIPEARFVETCERSGNCVKVCPAGAIRPLLSAWPKLDGTPVIEPDLAPCLVCKGLECMRVCPSGALKIIPEPEIRIGLARWREARCLRSDGEDCQICVARCPIGESAIRLDEAGRVDVLPTGCIGCGVCQFYCPAQPKAILVEPYPESPEPLAG
jgi:ferredoxin-type protein NapG